MPIRQHTIDVFVKMKTHSRLRLIRASVQDLFCSSGLFEEPEEQLTIKCEHVVVIVVGFIFYFSFLSFFFSVICYAYVLVTTEFHSTSVKRSLNISFTHLNIVIWCHLSSKCIVFICTNKVKEFKSSSVTCFTHWVKFFHSDCGGIYAEPLSHIYPSLHPVTELLYPSVHQRAFLNIRLYCLF